MANYRIILAHPCPLFRQGLKKIIGQTDDFRIVDQVENGVELGRMVREKRPDLVILDTSLPNLSGLDIIREIKECNPGIKVLVLTTNRTRESGFHAIHNHVDGYLLQEDDEQDLYSAIRQIRNGNLYLSPSFPRR